MKPLILLDAAPFCYGPISTLCAILDHLPRPDLRLKLLASGTSAEFARGYHAGLEIVDCDTEDPEDLEAHRELFLASNLFVSNTNPVSARYAVGLGCRTVYVDTLVWMWDEIDPQVAASELYVAQDFEGIDENFERLGAEIESFEVVGPLIASSAEGSRAPGNDCLISFGGIESSLTVAGETNRYPWVVTRLLCRAFERLPAFDRYLFAGRGRVMESLARDHGGPRREFRFVPHHELLERLASCRLCLLSPGLTGAYEALAAGARSYLLPPQNYSQQLQSTIFLEQAQWPFQGMHWGQIYRGFEMPAHLPEEQAVAEVNRLILRFESDAEAQERWLEHLVDAVGRLDDWPTGSGSPAGSEAVARMILKRLD